MQTIERDCVINKRYTIKMELGKGGFGHTFMAKDGLLDRLVAIKILSENAAKDRFEREARAGAKLNHPYIAQIFDYMENCTCSTPEGEDTCTALVMELVEGQTVKEKFFPTTPEESAPPDNEEVKKRLIFFESVLQAILYCHRMRVVHRDLQPKNILVTTNNLPKIIDFGLACINNEHTQTIRGNAMGTADYQAPEMFTAAEEGDQRADIFSLGMILYQLVTGRLPYKTNGNLSRLRELLSTGSFDSPLIYNEDAVDEHLAGIILKMIDKDRDKRYQDLADMADDWEKLNLGGAGLNSDLIRFKS